MSIRIYIVKALILSFFALNAFNTFKNAPAASVAFKTEFANFEETIRSRFGINLPVQIQSLSINKLAFEVVKYGALAQLVLSLLGVFWGAASGLVGLIYLTQQLVHLNFAKINLSSSADLEKYALPIALVVTVWAISFCSSNTKCNKKNRHGNESESSVQANTKKRH